MATVLQRTGSGAYYGKMTISFWVKRSKLGEQGIFGRREGSATANLSTCHFGGDDSLLINFRDGGGTSKYYMITDRLFRDVGAWYHIVFAIDGTHATASERSKLYVNGVRETSFQLLNNPSSTGYEVNMFLGGSYNTYIGRGLKSQTDTWLTFEGCMSHFHCSTGYTYDADVFGSTDSVTGEWKINTNPTFTPGTDGFTVLKDGNTITDQSANSNNFTVYSGTLTKTEDCPSNVFATMNPLSAGSNMTFGNGNTKIRNDVATWNSGLSTIAPATGKYYWEVYVHGGGDNNTGVSLSSAYGGNHSEVDAGRVVYSRNGAIYREGLSQGNGSTGVTYGDGDYIGVAFDTENGTLSFYKNGSAVSNSTTTDTSFLRSNNEYLVQCGLYNGGEFRFNFGNGAFGSTQLTGTTYQGDGNIGIFKYQPPTGYTALSTKGLNE